MKFRTFSGILTYKQMTLSRLENVTKWTLTKKSFNIVDLAIQTELKHVLDMKVMVVTKVMGIFVTVSKGLENRL